MRIIATNRRAAWLVVLWLASGLATPKANGQAAPRDFFTEPSLILTGGGHHAPVRSLAFATPDGSRLLSGGMDKVIHVWDLDAAAQGPIRTLRPPLWRGVRGAVAAMALSPIAGADGQRYLAVAGQGVIGGEILLFRYPGIDANGTGEIIAQLPSTSPEGITGPGHLNTVGTLAFSPDGRYLASGSNDKSVRIWEVASGRSVAVLKEATGRVNALTYFSRGTRLVVGGDDGILRLYDVTNPAQPRKLVEVLVAASNAADPLSRQVLTLAVDRYDRFLIVGTEGGLVLRYDAATLGGAATMPQTTTGAVETLAISPDGLRLVTSCIVRNITNGTVFPTVASLIQLRSMPDGAIVQDVATTSNIAYALAFSPDGRRLAFSGGDAQAIFVKDLNQPAAAIEERRGPGSSVWDVGFRLDGRALRFSRTRPATPGQAVAYEGFDLRDRRPILPDPGPLGYRHGSATEAGWTIRPVDVYQLEFAGPQGRVWPATLDQTLEGRWMSYAVIPPNAAAGHPSPIAAVGCLTGVKLWNLDNGQPVRFLAGHAGPVYGLASSPDGRWLATGSSDQTIRLWTLRDADQPARFGARFAPEAAGGTWVVVDVTPGGFAEGIGLKKGQTVEKFYVADRLVPPAEYPSTLLNLDLLPAFQVYTFEARQLPGGDLVRAGTTKRDYPALNLFPSEDGEWIVWTPRGYYDTSIMGDRRYLGWLTNRGTIALLQAGTFDTIDKFEPKYRQKKAPLPNVIDRLLDTADPVAALLALPPANPLDADPTNSRVVELSIRPVVPAPVDRPVAVQQPTIRINYRAVAAAGAAGVSKLWVEVNGRRAVDVPVAAPIATVAGQLDVAIGPGPDQRASLVMEDERGVQRRQDLPIANQTPPAPARRKARLEILAIGAESFADPKLPKIPFAGRDADDLAEYLRDRLIDPTTGARFSAGQANVRTFVDPRADAAGLVSALDDWRKAAKTGQFAADDVVALVVESHFFQVESRPLIATTEPTPTSLAADDLAARLLELTAVGCRVVILIDAVHGLKRDGWDGEIKEWVRQLQARSHVAVFLASEYDASRPGINNHRVFADGVLDVLKPKNASRLRTGTGPLSLFEFQRTVIDAVLRDTERRQRAKFFMPDTYSIGVPFLDSNR